MAEIKPNQVFKKIEQVPIFELNSDWQNYDHQLFQNQFSQILLKGVGVFVLRGTYFNLDLLDQINHFFFKTIALEKQNNSSPGDHFAKGTNDRIWNSLGKLAQLEPNYFIDYFKNPWIHLAAQSWLGINYQITAQANIVNPQGAAQSGHRDYHLGFQSQNIVKQFPVHAQVASQFLTLQGAIIHSDMPVETGPTKFFLYSQLWEDGYESWYDSDKNQFFENNFIQLPMKKGDMVFFNPALIHAAGENSTQDKKRIANLLQISSCMGKTMESLAFNRMIDSVYPELLKRKCLSRDEIKWTIQSIADNYPFPTNLDADQPDRNTRANQSQFDVVFDAFVQKLPLSKLKVKLEELQRKRNP